MGNPGLATLVLYGIIVPGTVLVSVFGFRRFRRAARQGIHRQRYLWRVAIHVLWSLSLLLLIIWLNSLPNGGNVLAMFFVPGFAAAVVRLAYELWAIERLARP